MVIYMEESALHNCCQWQKFNFCPLYACNVLNKLTLYYFSINSTKLNNLPQRLFYINYHWAHQDHVCAILPALSLQGEQLRCRQSGSQLMQGSVSIKPYLSHDTFGWNPRLNLERGFTNACLSSGRCPRKWKTGNQN